MSKSLHLFKIFQQSYYFLLCILPLLYSHLFHTFQIDFNHIVDLKTRKPIHSIFVFTSAVITNLVLTMLNPKRTNFLIVFRRRVSENNRLPLRHWIGRRKPCPHREYYFGCLIRRNRTHSVGSAQCTRRNDLPFSDTSAVSGIFCIYSRISRCCSCDKFIYASIIGISPF